MSCWQIGCGAVGRDYSEEFVKFGMAFVGGQTNFDRMRNVASGDLIVMKRGISEIVAAGRVIKAWDETEEKHWLRDFDGWDLRAYCYVDWHVPPLPIQVDGLSRGTIQQVHQQHLLDIAIDLLERHPSRKRQESEPRITKRIEDDVLLEFLVGEGLRPAAADELANAFARIRLLANYYYSGAGFSWDDVREHETRSFLIVPLMLALGWAEQQMKIELPAGGRTRADVACFRRPYRGDSNDCVLILESKGLSQGLMYARDQAEGYASHFPNSGFDP